MESEWSFERSGRNPAFFRSQFLFPGEIRIVTGNSRVIPSQFRAFVPEGVQFHEQRRRETDVVQNVIDGIPQVAAMGEVVQRLPAVSHEFVTIPGPGNCHQGKLDGHARDGLRAGRGELLLFHALQVRQPGVKRFPDIVKNGSCIAP